ncbi:MAG: glycosyltransferase family 4 protein [Acidimicrobiales bacterium]
MSSAFVAVHQLLPSLHVADASGAHTLHARDALRAAGYRSELFVGQVDPPLAGEVHPLEALDDHVVPGRTALLYQLAVGSPIVDLLLGRGEPLIVNYHNLTPASFFWQWAPDWLEAVETGRQQLHRLAPRTAHAIAVSRFNQEDLVAAGYRSTSVVPPFVDVASFAAAGRKLTDTGAERGGARWLFVGKLLPHKAAHDIVKALAAYRAAYDPNARLVLVGGQPVAAYASAVRSFVGALGLGDAVELAGGVSHDRLAELYRTSDVFVCLSRHEGFCFPLLEAMHHGLPVVALDAGAVPDTLGDAGVVVPDAEPARVAAAVHRVLTDAALRRALREAGHRRLAEYDLGATKELFAAEVRGVLDAFDRVAAS